MFLPGTYDLVAEFPGFTKAERQNIEVRVGDTLDIDIPLQVGNNIETVVVTGTTPLLEAANVYSLGPIYRVLPVSSGSGLTKLIKAPG